MKVYFLIAALFKLTVAISTFKTQNVQDEHTTLPTELFKPLAPVTEKSQTGNSYQTGLQRVVPYLTNNGHNVMNEPNSFPNAPSQIGFNAGLYDVLSRSRIHQQTPIQTGPYYQLTNQFPSAGLHDVNFNEGPDITAGNAHYRYSSSSTYYDSNSMDGPQTHGFEYDSRKGGFEFK